MCCARCMVGAVEAMAPACRTRKIEVIVGILILVYMAVAMALWIDKMPSPPPMPADCYGPVMCGEKESYAEMLTFYLLLGLLAVAVVPSVVLGFLKDLGDKRDSWALGIRGEETFFVGVKCFLPVEVGQSSTRTCFLQ